jgi:serine/threonine protein kinase
MFQHIGKHPNIIELIAAAENDQNVYMVTEYCDGGELYSLIESGGALPEIVSKKYSLQILAGLEHMIQKHVVHRDLSAENILLTNGRTECKIIDFGMAILMPSDPLSGAVVRMKPQGTCGKGNYIAPEIHSQDPFFGHLVDIWSFGVTLFIILTGVPPMTCALPSDEAYRMIRDDKLREVVDQWQKHIPYVNPLAIDLIQNIFREDPMKRLRVRDVSAHSWMQL